MKRLPGDDGSGFSVLMSLYFRELPESLEECLRSIFNQTLPAKEVVIVKDGPLGKELEDVLQKYMNLLPLRLVSLPENSGLGIALRHGLQYCSYSYIIRCDSDDVNSPNRFEKLINYLTQNKEVDCVGSWIGEFDSSSELARNYFQTERRLPVTHKDIKLFSKLRNPMNHMSVAFRKHSVVESGSYIDIPYFEDYHLWMRMLKRNCIFYNIPEILVSARRGESFFVRRTGIRYVISEAKFQFSLCRLGIINVFEMLINLLIRVPPKTLPPNLSKLFYTSILRQS